MNFVNKLKAKHLKYAVSEFNDNADVVILIDGHEYDLQEIKLDEFRRELILIGR